MSTGNFVWFDYVAADVDKAIAFYGEVIGWKAEAWGDERYRTLSIGDRATGGVMALPDRATKMAAQPHWLAYIGTDDIDHTVARAVELGGRVLRDRFEIPEVGHVAILQDPQGAVFAATSFFGEAPELPEVEKPGAFCWSELMTTDAESAIAFYTALFGWSEGDSMEMGDSGVYQMIETPGPMGLGVMSLPDAMPMPMWLYYVNIDDIEAATRRILRLGGTALHEPVEVPGGGKVAQFIDNQGGAFALYQNPE